MSYTLTANMSCNVTTNTQFRAWGSIISYAMANSGWVLTANSLDWSSAPAPNVVSQTVGWEVWRMNDAMQNTVPVYLYIGYGSTAAANVRPALYMRVGSGVNTSFLTAGVGPLTGFLGPQSGNMQLQPGATSTNTTMQSLFCGDTGRMAFGLWCRGSSTSTYVCFFSIERTCDANGNPTSDGVFVIDRSTVSPYYNQLMWHPTIGQILWEPSTTSLAILNPAAGGSTLGSNTSVYPVYFTRGGGPFLQPGLGVFAYFHPEFSAGTANTFSVYGSNHTFMPLGNTAWYGGTARSNNSITYMMRWE
jgi:hypothetical protein